MSGCLLFVILYLAAAMYYPGGTPANRNSQGFSWSDNYWCNLLNDTAINGQPNSAQPIAFAAMLVLVVALTVFWIIFPLVTGFKVTARLLIGLSGATSMLLAFFIFTGLHDLIINVAGLFGLIALGGTLIGLVRLRWMTLFYLGLIVIFLIGLNNLMYYSPGLTHYLPAVQKITFAFFLFWICSINIRWLAFQSSASVT